MKHLVIGNGAAGVVAAEMIRKHAPCDSIMLLGNEPGPSYSLSLLPRLVSGDIGESGCHLRSESDHFYRLRIEQRFGRISRIDSKAHKVLMEDGVAFGYDRLLIATGASACIPTIPGIHSPGVHACRTLQDARRIVALARPRAHVVLVGAGLTGCVLMEALAARHVHLAVIEQNERMASNMMPAGAAGMLKRWCESKGVRICTSTRILAIERINQGMAGGPRLVARLSNGECLFADLIVCATGAQPNIGFLRGSGIACTQGILVDASMQTSVPGIYAAGDCAETFDAASGRMVIAGVLPNAVDQACCAALNMIGKSAFQHHVRRIEVLATMGLVTSSFGEWHGLPGGQWVEASDERNYRYLRLEFRKDVLVGANAVGLREQHGMLRDLVQHQVALGEWKDRLLRNPAHISDAYRACVRRHGGANADIADQDIMRSTMQDMMRGQASPETVAAIAYRTISNAARRPPPARFGNPS
ncbi:NAD(P)/FAD-dependent oxidoreductase [Noviherbaspirillum cavernae]|uniref:NAD(P)/FAD-dependent oxidoreductase n=1 Tax=Noviherbaspirillum cavernae TaxID=2320862 RepID=A0A418X6J2_9BURK|nr:FAD-dependent oxidoreductase [Noviherbaspirillum cavernae]RJG08006.1 NAD(P)/FAD-dependent oxidoreductase [Noviherbaspirillum cavernae]